MSAVEILEVANIKEDNDSDSNGTKNVGCGNAYVQGRCLGSDPENCLYENLAEKGADKCAGSFKMAKVPTGYICKDQIG